MYILKRHPAYFLSLCTRIGTFKRSDATVDVYDGRLGREGLGRGRRCFLSLCTTMRRNGDVWDKTSLILAVANFRVVREEVIDK